MIIAERKPFDEIKEMVQGCKNLLVLGCGTCVSVCMAGGEKEVELLTSQLNMSNQLENKDIEIKQATVQRQCDREYIEPISEMAGDYDLVLSMACGAGVQLVADILEPVPVIPALNTCFIGITEAEGVWAEQCESCGSCILDLTGGICPIARCAKGLLNGPCGGSVDGKCEVAPDTACAWQLIIDRLTALGQLDKLDEVEPTKDWGTSHSGGPRRVKLDTFDE